MWVNMCLCVLHAGGVNTTEVLLFPDWVLHPYKAFQELKALVRTGVLTPRTLHRHRLLLLLHVWVLWSYAQLQRGERRAKRETLRERLTMADLSIVKFCALSCMHINTVFMLVCEHLHRFYNFTMQLKTLMI